MSKDIPEGYQLSTPEELAHHERVTTTVASAIKEMGVEAFGLVYSGPGGKIRSGMGGWSPDALAAVMTVGADCFRLTVERWMGGLGGTTTVSLDGEAAAFTKIDALTKELDRCKQAMAAAYRLTIGDDRRPVKQIAEILLTAFHDIVRGKKEAGLANIAVTLAEARAQIAEKERDRARRERDMAVKAALWKPGDFVAGVYLVRLELDGNLIGPASDGRSNKVVWWFSHEAGGPTVGVASLNNLIGKVLEEEDRASSGEPRVPETRGNRVGDEGIVIHVLQMGKACCGQPGIPADWPAGHRWVPLMKKGDATCKLCIQALDDKDKGIRNPR